MKKYFHAENINRRIAGVLFEPYETFAGTTLGVYRATTEEEIAALSQEALRKEAGVTEISEEQFFAFLKKKPETLNSFAHLNPKSPQVQLKGKGAVVVEDPTASSSHAAGQGGSKQEAPSVDDALLVDRVNPDEAL